LVKGGRPAERHKLPREVKGNDQENVRNRRGVKQVRVPPKAWYFRGLRSLMTSGSKNKVKRKEVVGEKGCGRNQ